MSVAESSSTTELDTGVDESIDESVHGVDALILPGKGAAGDRCGEWRVSGFCDAPTRPDGGAESHVDLGVHHCGRRGCPDCWGRWARDRTVSAVVRLGAAREVEPPTTARRAVHTVVSPEEGAVESVSEFYRYRTKAVEKAREAGVRGGLAVPHAFRATEAAKTAWGRVGGEKKLWAWIRECDVPWTELVEWGPHYHVIGLAREVEPVGDGWVVRRLGTFDEWDRNDRGAYDDMAGAVRYLLSHATYPEEENRQVVTWFGSVHGTNFDPEEELTKTVYQRIEQLAEEVVGVDNPDDGGAGHGEEEEEPECAVDGCSGHVHPIHEVQDFLEQNNLSPLNEMVLRTALRWSRGDLDPPPGLQHPTEFVDAREALGEMVRREYAGTARYEQVRGDLGGAGAVTTRSKQLVAATGRDEA